MIKMERPWAIIPVLPEKNMNSKLWAVDSHEVQERRQGLEAFLKKLIENQYIYTSIKMKEFLTKKDTFEIDPIFDSLDLSFLRVCVQ